MMLPSVEWCDSTPNGRGGLAKTRELLNMEKHITATPSKASTTFMLHSAYCHCVIIRFSYALSWLQTTLLPKTELYKLCTVMNLKAVFLISWKVDILDSWHGFHWTATVWYNVRYNVKNELALFSTIKYCFCV